MVICISTNSKCQMPVCVFFLIIFPQIQSKTASPHSLIRSSSLFLTINSIHYFCHYLSVVTQGPRD